MHSPKNDQHGSERNPGLAGFVGKRLAVSVVLVIGVLWVLSFVLDRLNLGQLDDGFQPETVQSEPTSHGQSPDETQKPPDDSIEEQQTADAPQTEDTAEQYVERSSDQAAHPADASDLAHLEHSALPSENAAILNTSMAQHDDTHQESSSTGEAASTQPPEPTTETGVQGPSAMTAANESHAEAQEPRHPPVAADGKESEASSGDKAAGHDTQVTAPQKTEAPSGDKAAGHDTQVSVPQKTEAPHEPSEEPVHAAQPRGVPFVEAVMQPLDQELNQRFWGWRPNDIFNVTDNVNTSQLGILEVTRRTVVQLTQRISRTGSTDTLNPNLENAMNWLMVKADRYWFPAPESKYKESLEELAAYKEMLIKGKASFYIRPDNLIPLLTEYEDLLGSCDENLVKTREDDGSSVSFFKADDYFYYARGVASAMAVILKAVYHDFSPTLDSRHGSDLLHHAILSCEIAAKLSPLVIMNSDLDGFFANHRANMAAPISHARFYISQLIKTLST